MHIQSKISDLDCLWESARPNFSNLEYEKAKNVKGVGNQSSREAHVITMSFHQKDYRAVVAYSSARALLPTWFQDTYIGFHS